jgi:hypothetical protein
MVHCINESLVHRRRPDERPTASAGPGFVIHSDQRRSAVHLPPSPQPVAFLPFPDTPLDDGRRAGTRQICNRGQLELLDSLAEAAGVTWASF